METTPTVVVRLQRSKSASYRAAVEQFADRSTEDGAFDGAVFTFREDEPEAISACVGSIGRLRNVTVVWRNTEYSRQDFETAFWDEMSRREDEEFWRRYEAAGRTWPIPSDEFLALAAQSANGGDWDGVEAGRPLPPDAYDALLRLFAGGGLDPAIVEAARRLRALRDGRSFRDIARAVGEEHRVNPWDIEAEIHHAMHVGDSLNEPGRPRSELVYFMVSPHCCMACRRHYLEADGKTPRVFYLHELEPTGANVGRPLEDWRPTRPPLHRFCGCRLWPWTRFTPAHDWMPSWEETRITRLPSLLREPVPSSFGPPIVFGS